MKISNSYYFDHQATCPLDSSVFDEMCHFMVNSVGNSHSSEHAFGWEAGNAVSNATTKIAEMVGCDPDEIFFTSGATEANNLAIKGYGFGTRETLIHSSIEHKCVIEAGRYLEAQGGLKIRSVGVDTEGRIDLDELVAMASNTISMFSFIGVNNEIGTIQDFHKIADICRRHGIKIHADMAQAPLAMNLRDMIDCVDTLSLSAHKYYGPMGIGCLYIRRDVQHEYSPQIHGGGQQSGMRSGTVPVPLAVGMGKASEIIMQNTSERDDMRAVNQLLWDQIKKLDFEVALNGPSLNDRHPGSLNVSFAGFDSADIIAAVQPHLAISSGSACSSGTIEPSYVVQNSTRNFERSKSAIRFGIGRSTNENDVGNAVAILDRALRKISEIAKN